MFGKISIRNIPQQIWIALEALADKHDRSTEAEARYALRAWVEPSLLELDRSTRRAEVSGRLRSVLEQVNTARTGSALRPSHLAQAIGEDRAEVVEDWFTGRAEPSFSQLAATATYFGVVTEWLQHGDAQMFPLSHHHRVPEDATAAFDWLLSWDEENLNAKVTALHLAREASTTGGLIVIKENGEGHCKTFPTQYHVSEEIGSGGETALAHLWVTLELLYKHPSRSATTVKSYLLAPNDFDALRKGNTHPLAVLNRAQHATWWEDIWDKTMYPKQKYWSGWLSVCEGIGRAVASRPRLVEELDKIRRGEHPVMTR